MKKAPENTKDGETKKMRMAEEMLITHNIINRIRPLTLIKVLDLKVVNASF